MAEELQSLLEKINTDGIQKARAAGDEILAAARKQADEIIAAANAKAQTIVNEAGEEARRTVERSENAIRQSARDVALQLKSELESRLKTAVSNSAKEAMTPAFMASLIRDMALACCKDPDGEVKVFAAVNQSGVLENAVKDTLNDSFRKMPQIFGDSGVKGGLQISFNGEDVFMDFSTDAIVELVGNYTSERIRKILEEK